MLTITKSGLYQNDAGQTLLVTQGIAGYTLVAGKQFLIRFFVDPTVLPTVNAIKLMIGSVGILLPRADLIIETQAPHGPSVGCIVRGYACPGSGNYTITINCKDTNLNDVTLPAACQFVFLPSKDIRFMVVPIQGSAPSRNFLFSPAWVADIQKAMQRLNCMFPVRDCVHNNLDHNFKTGIRYHIAAPLEGWPLEVGLGAQDYLQETKQFNAAAGPGTDWVDVTIVYRPCQPACSESPGGIALLNGITQPSPRVDCVGGFFNILGIDMSAPCFAQEVAHLFGLEPVGSPGYQDLNNLSHSKNSHISDPYAFDFVNKRPFPPDTTAHWLGDTMNNLASGVWQGSDSVMFSPFDWESLRQGIVKLNNHQTGTDINPTLKDSCGIHYFKLPQKTISIPLPIYTKLIGSRADGKLYKWGNHGFEPVDPKRDPDTPFYHAIAVRVLLEFKRSEVKDVYIPKDGELMDITSPLTFSLHDGNTDLPEIPGLMDEK